MGAGIFTPHDKGLFRCPVSIRWEPGLSLGDGAAPSMRLHIPPPHNFRNKNIKPFGLVPVT